MSLCTRNKWGPGTQSTNKNDSNANKEMEEKLKKLQQERDKQDTMWATSNNTTTNSNTKTGK
jgi:hypothetical protein